MHVIKCTFSVLETNNVLFKKTLRPLVGSLRTYLTLLFQGSPVCEWNICAICW